MSQQDTDGNFIYFQYDTGDTPVVMLYNDRQYYYVTNQFGDVTAIIDNDGYVVCEYVYGDWGEILDITGDLEIAETNPLRYRGYYYDNETGYYYLQSRYYDPNICRFINADIFSLVSIDTLLGINIFIYCQNDPINFIDPTGYYSIAESEKTNNWFEAVMKALVIAIPVDAFTRAFESFIQTFNHAFNFNKWFEKLSDKMQSTLEDISIAFTTMLHTAWREGKEYVEEFFLLFSFDKIVDWLVNSKGFSFNISNLISFTTAFGSKETGKYTLGQAWFSTIFNWILSAISIFVPMGFGGKIGMQTLSFISNFILDSIFNFQNGHLWGTV